MTNEIGVKSLNVFFDVHYLYYWPHFAPIWHYLEALDQPVYGYATFSTKDTHDAQDLTRQVLTGENLHILHGDNEEQRLQQLKSTEYDIAFIGASKPGFNVIREQSKVVCSMSHGLGTKQAYFKDNPGDVDIRFTEGPQHHEELRKRYPDLSIELAGMAKLDPLFDGDELQIEDRRREYRISADTPVILWAPTFYPSSLEKLHKTVRKLANSADYQWILKPHHFTYFPRQWRYKRQYRLVQKLAKSSDNIILLPPSEFSVLPWLGIADMLLSDTSSTLFEMVALDKPVIRCDTFGVRWNHKLFPKRLFKRRLDRDTTSDFTYAIEIDSDSELKEALYQASKDPEWLQNGRRETIDNLFYQLDGKTSERIVDRALELLEK